ncbi:MAG: pathogenesis-related family 1 protein [Cyanobacteria bacterium]|nr:pathogenesis-related family 1 protein [Cyanobacteriota bacterium]MDW8201023.1 pathogenesis-related family 1 protein [Cyanobacteriota bacterium SKYGB_h_bin112]
MNISIVLTLLTLSPIVPPSPPHRVQPVVQVSDTPRGEQSSGGSGATSGIKQASSAAVGNYCSVVYANGGWQLFWHTAEDACRFATCLGSNCQLASRGRYFLGRQNQVTVTCRGFSRTFTGMGDRPLADAFNTVANPFQPACAFTVNQGVSTFTSPPLGGRPSPTNPSSSGSNSTIGQAPNSVAQEMVAAHNRWRSQVGVPPLRWSPQLASYAQDWANQLAARGAFEHRRDSPYGENLFWGQGRRWSPTEVVNDWGSEVKDYDYATNSCRGVCGHYTQVVWRDTTEVGCGVARSGNQEIWVCNYNPPGNYLGRKPY